MMQHLRPYFDVYSICLLGMGASGRPSDLNLTDFDSTVDFFAKSIHKYTEKAGLGQNGEKFYLLGHSLGGFIAA